jgi:hypothetical protein
MAKYMEEPKTNKQYRRFNGPDFKITNIQKGKFLNLNL